LLLLCLLGKGSIVFLCQLPLRLPDCLGQHRVVWQRKGFLCEDIIVYLRIRGVVPKPRMRTHLACSGRMVTQKVQNFMIEHASNLIHRPPLYGGGVVIQPPPHVHRQCAQPLTRNWAQSKDGGGKVGVVVDEFYACGCEFFG